MKRKYHVIITAFLLALLLIACGSSSQASSQDGATDGGQEQTETTDGNSADTAEVSPYAWLGFEDMPKCNYLDIVASNHYIMESEDHIKGLSYVSKETNAVDGINTYKKNESNTVYSIGGKVTTINESSKYYLEQDSSSLAETAQRSLDSAMKNGENIKGRSFHGTGKEAVPIISEEDDKTEYEYYEYNYPETEKNSGDSIIERYYFKDGDVFAIYTKATWGDTVIEDTEVIKSISGDIPDGTFELPDLSDYEKKEF